jgi:translation initiation factor 2 subunit 1
LDETTKDCLLKEIRHRLAEQPIKIQAQIEVTCFTSAGILAVKQALSAGKVLAEGKNQKLEINLLSTPVYRLTTQCTDKQQGIDLVNDAIKEVEKVIKELQGNISVKEEAQEI